MPSMDSFSAGSSRSSRITASGVSAIEMITMAVMLAAVSRIHHAAAQRLGIEHERELAALREQHGAAERLAVAAPGTGARRRRCRSTSPP